MALDFKTISMMELRSTPGEILDRVYENDEAFIIERKGELLACLVPAHLFIPNIKRDRINYELDELNKNGVNYKIRFSDDNELEVHIDYVTENFKFLIKIIVPHGYPNFVPKVYVSPLDPETPHRWNDSSLCIYGAYTNWNPGAHTIYTTQLLAEKWLKSYVNWKNNKSWEIK